MSNEKLMDSTLVEELQERIDALDLDDAMTLVLPMAF